KGGEAGRSTEVRRGSERGNEPVRLSELRQQVRQPNEPGRRQEVPSLPEGGFRFIEVPAAGEPGRPGVRPPAEERGASEGRTRGEGFLAEAPARGGSRG